MRAVGEEISEGSVAFHEPFWAEGRLYPKMRRVKQRGPQRERTMTRKALAALAAISVAGCSAPPNEDPIESREQPIVGGVETPACAWPTTVSFSQNGAGCTATLIHPKMITVADHCLEGNGGTIKLTDSLSGRAPRTIAIQRCIPRPAGVNGGEDFAVCLLAEEVNDVPVIPVLFGCETDILKPGQEVALVGFGFIGENKQNPNGHKRWVMAKINRINSGRKSIDIGDPMHQNCFGDSGGPAFVKLADGTWRVFGVTSTTNSPARTAQGTPAACCGKGASGPASTAIVA